MKILTLSLLLFSISIISINAQDCLPGGILFYNQSQIDNFQVDYPGCTHIEGDVTIGNGYLTDITNLNGLSVVEIIDGSLNFDENEVLTGFSGLDALETIGGDLIVYGNELISDFSGFGSLETIDGEFRITENNNLTSFSGLSSLTTVNGIFEMGHNLIFSSFNGLQSLEYVGGFEISYLHNLLSLNGLGLTSVGGNVQINSCNSLENLVGFNLVTTINGYLFLNQNPSLSVLLGLEGLTSIDGSLHFYDNPNISSLTALSYLTQVGGDLIIGGCDMMADLAGLEALTSIGGSLEINGNQQLTTLSGIDNIAPQSISNLKISYNSILSVCDVKSICDYLVSPGGNIFIQANASGCSSQIEVENSCATGIYDPDSKISFLVYPNPAENTIKINIQDKITIERLSIYNRLGQIVLSANPANNTIDVSALETGMYFVEVSTLKGKARQKLIIE